MSPALRSKDDWNVISPAYREIQRALHASPGGYGGKGYKWAPTVIAVAQRFDAGSILDYGCGQGRLGAALRDAKLSGVRIDEYDPAVAKKDGIPLFADLVVSTDVLEHVEPDRLTSVLAHIKLLARKAVFLVVALEPANKLLPDGRNAHLILESREWWQARIAQAGFRLESADGLPFHRKYRPENQHKRLIAIGVPC